jgi:hypothetical protein
VAVHDGRGVVHHPDEIGHGEHRCSAAGVVLIKPLLQLGLDVLLLRCDQVIARPAQDVVATGLQVLACPRLLRDVGPGVGARPHLPGPGPGAEDRSSVGGKVGRPVHPAVLAVDLTGEVHYPGSRADTVGLGTENVTKNLDDFLRTEPTQPAGESEVHRLILSRPTGHRRRGRHDLAALRGVPLVVGPALLSHIEPRMARLTSGMQRAGRSWAG